MIGRVSMSYLLVATIDGERYETIVRGTHEAATEKCDSIYFELLGRIEDVYCIETGKGYRYDSEQGLVAA